MHCLVRLIHLIQQRYGHTVRRLTTVVLSRALFGARTRAFTSDQLHYSDISPLIGCR